mgnify:CR=1 FL=1
MSTDSCGWKAIAEANRNRAEILEAEVIRLTKELLTNRELLLNPIKYRCHYSKMQFTDPTLPEWPFKVSSEHYTEYIAPTTLHDAFRTKRSPQLSSDEDD